MFNVYRLHLGIGFQHKWNVFTHSVSCSFQSYLIFVCELSQIIFSPIWFIQNTAVLLTENDNLSESCCEELWTEVVVSLPTRVPLGNLSFHRSVSLSIPSVLVLVLQAVPSLQRVQHFILGFPERRSSAPVGRGGWGGGRVAAAGGSKALLLLLLLMELRLQVSRSTATLFLLLRSNGGLEVYFQPVTV